MEGQLKDALRSIEMPNSYYDKAIASYESISKDLTSEKSELSKYLPRIILQGSIKIGTAIKPVTKDGSYDIDLVCNLSSLRKKDISQSELKETVGKEVLAYARHHGMSNIPHNGKRCWTLEYVDEANFHIDILPTVIDSYDRTTTSNAREFDVIEGMKRLAHPDSRHPRYREICDDWLTTNPEGFAEWFLEAAAYEQHRFRAAVERSMSIEEVRVYTVKSPLQAYVQLLKRHRDIFCAKSNCESPVRSVVLTTLAARAYEAIPVHGGWYEDFVRVAKNIPSYIELLGQGYAVINPSNSLENFLFDWGPESYEKFLQWHRKMMSDLVIENGIRKRRFINKYALDDLRESLGVPVKSIDKTSLSSTRLFLDHLPHHRQHGMTELDAVKVEVTARRARSGGLYVSFSSGDPLAKGMSLQFDAKAEDIKRFDIMWQITNNDQEALNANCLRGDFYKCSSSSNGRRMRYETTLYKGKHYVECLLTKDNVVYGRSDPFVVNII
ncbi:MAG: nucleotidyltransferase [Coriobacteriia bacterium]|nr:nucleotidyltransferase [Coriobacteriia bacterium]